MAEFDPSHTPDVIVVGGSADAVPALREVLGGLPADLPAALLVVVHAAQHPPGSLPEVLGGPLPARYAIDGEPIELGRVYVAPPDRHLLVEPAGCVRLSRGPRQNRFRPAIEPLFRTAARVFGPQVIGVVLSGLRDDGALGLTQVARFGGITICMAPAEGDGGDTAAELRHARPDYILKSSEMAAALNRLVREPGPGAAHDAASASGRRRPALPGDDRGERERIEDALRRSEERFRLIVENVLDYAIFTCDPAGNVTSWNPGAGRIFGYAVDEIMGRNAAALFTPEDRAAGEHEKELAIARRQGRASDDRWQMRKGGERFWASGVTTALYDDAGNLTGFTKILRDETPRKQLEERLRSANEALEQRVAERTASLEVHQRQLRSLVAELGRGELRQRRGLSAELHDNLAQLLAVCKMRASAIEAQAPRDTPLKTEAAMVKDGLQEAITYVRGLMADLRPDVLDEHDLAAAVEWAGERMTRHGLRVDVIDDGRPKPLNEEVLGFLFQAVRELLWNVVKHAKTTEAVVHVERGDGVVRVTVEDRGRGFDPSKQVAPTEEGGFGLFSIAERIDLIGGRMEIQSARRKGTKVTLTAPLESGKGRGADQAG